MSMLTKTRVFAIWQRRNSARARRHTWLKANQARFIFRLREFSIRFVNAVLKRTSVHREMVGGLSFAVNAAIS